MIFFPEKIRFGISCKASTDDSHEMSSLIFSEIIIIIIIIIIIPVTSAAGVIRAFRVKITSTDVLIRAGYL